MALVIFLLLTWKNIGTYFFPARFFKAEMWLEETEDWTTKAIPSASLEYLRWPNKKRIEHMTMMSTRYPESSTQRYTIEEGDAAKLEMGLVRTEKMPIGPNNYSFDAYELQNGTRKKLVETSRAFYENSWALFEVSRDATEQETGGEMEIEYVLKAAGLKARAASILARIRGLPPYYKNFAFLTPNVLRERKADERNVILVSFDTLRPDHLSCFGYPRPTSPNIDALASDGVLFTQAVSTASWTRPAHFSLFTGLYPSSHLTELEKIWLCRVHTDRFLAAILNENGYYTIAFTGGVNLSSANDFNIGFDRYHEINRNRRDNAQRVFQNAVDWLDTNRDTKFFMFLHTNQSHLPYRDRYFLELEKPSTLPEMRKALYDGEIRNADIWFGTLIDKLKSLDLYSKTAIVVVSDHGDELYEHFTREDIIRSSPDAGLLYHGHSAYDEVIRVLTLFYLPGLRLGKRTLSNQVTLIDVMPTILDYLDIPCTDPVQGSSLLSLIETGQRAEDPPSITEYMAFGPEQKSVRLNGYKYIYTADPAESKGSVAFRSFPRHALFDLNTDPGEKNNIYDEKKELAEKYHAMLEETMAESLTIKHQLKKREIPGRKDNEIPQDVIDGLKALGYVQ